MMGVGAKRAIGLYRSCAPRQRRAYGYRDEEYLKLKIVAAFLPPLPRNAVFNPHESA